MDEQPPQLPKRYSKPEWYSGPGLWRKLKRVAGTASRKTLRMALVLFHCMRDKDTPTWAKGVIVGALGYLILPVDMVPDLIPGAGFGDDFGAILAALTTVAAYIKDEHKLMADEQLARLFGDPDADPPAEFRE